jgi:xylulokinase
VSRTPSALGQPTRNRRTRRAAPLILAIDHGTSGIKGALVTAFGEVLNHTFEPVSTTFLPGGGAEQDPAHWWEALKRAGATLLARLGRGRSAVAAVAVSSTFSSTVAVGPDGEAVAPCLTWMDARGAPFVRRLMGGFPAVAGYALPNLVRWVSRTGGGPSLSGKDDVGHVLYWMHSRPDIYERTAWFLPSKDYLNLKLTGVAASSFDAMTLFWVTDTRDPFAIRYDPELIARFGIDPGRLPTMRPSASILGRLRPAVARELGLRQDVQVVVGSPDHQSAGLGAGAVLDFDGHLYIGTSSWVQCTVPFRKTDVLHSIASLPTAIPGRYYCANEQDMAGGCLDLALRLLGVEGDQPYERLTALAAAVEPGAGGLVFAPWLNGERTPVDDPNLGGVLLNLTPATTPGQVARAVMEGVACNTRWSLEHVERFVGRALAPLSLVGGGARSTLWGQIFADVLDRPLRCPVAPQQANARGAAFVAAVALGEIGFQDIPALMVFERTFEPHPGLRQLYDDRYHALRDLHRSTRRLFARLNRGKR